MNDCEKAFAILGAHHADEATPKKLTFKRIAAPAGTISDGTRAFTVRPCYRWRYLIAELGGDTVAEIDQREHFQAPERMALAVLEAIEARAERGRGGTRGQFKDACRTHGPDRACDTFKKLAAKEA